MPREDKKHALPRHQINAAAPPELCPTSAEWRFWKSYIPTTSVPDPDGWWWGWCPLHDTVKQDGVWTAQISFAKGCMRCLGEVSCHTPKRARSLINIVIDYMRHSAEDVKATV